jgi:uracil-DNA glycosylase
MEKDHTYWNLNYWKSGEWQVIQERLDDLEKANISFNPKRDRLFAALEATPLEKVKVVWLGQDPYPGAEYATGLAFSVPHGTKIPPTLQTIFEEYVRDLQYVPPVSGDLLPWASQGVLLWNVVPTCTAGQSLSHYLWTEWQNLTKEVIRRTGDQGAVFALSGSTAREFYRCIDSRNPIIMTSHPSPRAGLKSAYPFVGSRIFSRINEELVKMGKTPINWNLGGEHDQERKAAGQAPKEVRKETSEGISAGELLGLNTMAGSSDSSGADGGGD